MGADLNWHPSASIKTLRVRADFLTQTRIFFASRGLLEVETPVLSSAATTDVNLHSIACQTTLGAGWLQTSPELFMKRLLAAGSGPIWQLCKVFRDGELGRWHNPEFSMLEWYRPGYACAELQAEVVALVNTLAPTTATLPVETLTYRAAFQRFLSLDPLTVDKATLTRCLVDRGISDATDWTRAEQLDGLMSHVISPQLGVGSLCFLTEFPADQAALACLKPDDPAVALRFELFWQGLELANGFEELIDVHEQQSRFEADVRERKQRGLPVTPVDQRFIAALSAGMPSCSGVAVGFDRLFALYQGTSQLSEAISFDFLRA